jgi:hypothetical protein
MKSKYECLAARQSPDDFAVLSTKEFGASDIDAAKSILARGVANTKAQGFVPPNAIRLIDPSGEEIWRALIAGPRPAARRRIYYHPFLRPRTRN